MIPGCRYTAQDHKIIASWGWPTPQTQQVDAATILAWWIYPEMTFDITEIQLNDGHTLRWLDYDGSLRTALRQVAKDREIETPEIVEPLGPANGG